MKVLGWDGTGTVLWYKRSTREVRIPRPERDGEASVIVSDAAFEAIFAGLSTRVVH